MNDLGGLNDEQWRELCDCASRLERTLLGGATVVDLHRFLPPAEAPHRRAVLVELIKTEQEARYRRGEGLPLEEFLKQYPEIGGRDDVPAGLIYEEYRVRRLYGDRPDLATYRERFPRQFEHLSQLLRERPIPEAPGSARPPSADNAPMPPTTEWGTVTAPPSPQGSQDAAPPPAATPMPPLPDRVLSGGLGYQKLEPLGRGEFGEVWRALAPGGVEVAVEIILRTLDHEASQRELKALEKIRQLRHPFLLQTHQYQSEKDHLVIVMELADGSLSDRFKACKAGGLSGIPPEELVTYFIQAAEALDYLHSQHVAHRDIKPQNLLMLRGYAKVADFGLARAQDQTVDEASMMCGTPHYMPPEMWRQQVSIHSDQYSLAAAYVEMRLGRRIFPGKSFYEIAEHHLKSEPQLDPLPRGEQAVLRRALAKEPGERYPTCTAFAEALREAVTPKKAEPPPPSTWRLKALVAVLALVLVGVLGAVAIFKSKNAPAPSLWTPEGWQAENPTEVVHDPRSQRDFYKRLVRDEAGQKVVMIAIPPIGSADPTLFYMMENKVWNDLYRAFLADPESQRLFDKYRSRQGSGKWFGGEWEEGATVPADPTKALGVGEGRGKIPVFRLKVTEAHCFAEWLGGRLPQRPQWLKAAGNGEDPRPGPFDGDGGGIAVNLGNEGPWRVDRGDKDVSKYGCRQMAGNGKEWTRTLQIGPEEIPLEWANGSRPVLVCGQSYAASMPLLFANIQDLDTKSCDEADPEISFRVVLEP